TSTCQFAPHNWYRGARYYSACGPRHRLLFSDRCGVEPQSASRPLTRRRKPASLPLKNPTGALMKLSVSFKDVERHNPIEKELERAVAKLNTLLKTYEPDLVQLHAVFSKVPRTAEHALALNLTLPTGSLHATASNEHLRACCKRAFSEIESQVK